MIKDNIKNFNKYLDLPERVKLGLNYLMNTDFSSIENGKYEIKGDEVFAIVQEYTPKPESEGKFEAHKKYTDIQYIIKGEEKMGFGEIGDFVELTEYNQEKDIVFLSLNKDGVSDFVTVKEEEFVIFTPNDAHMPSIKANSSENVKKIVVKVLV